MNEFVLNGLVKRRASVTRAPKPRKINEQKNRAAGAIIFRLAQSRIQLLSVGGAHACVTLILGHEVGVANAC